jgi:hypothetical protein
MKARSIARVIDFLSLQAIELQPRTTELDNTCLKLERHSVFTLPLKRW